MVRFETRGRVAVLTLDRPEARNAIDPDTAEAIEAAVDAVESDPAIWVGVLAGAGPVFCAGADLKAVGAGLADRLVTARGGFAGLVSRQRAKPLIAAVEGPALAGGTELVLACDLVVASEAASFGLPEVKRSLVAGAGGLFRLGRKLPLNVAMECVLTGDPIDARRAFGYGLVNDLCPTGEALDRALALAERICANAPVAVRESRGVMVGATYADDEVGWRMSAAAMSAATSSVDFHEGVSAFIEKRQPVWRGT